MSEQRSIEQLGSDTEACPHCDGRGWVPRMAARDFPIGSKVHYRVKWWMYPEGTDAEVVGHSRSGQRIKIKYPCHDYRGKVSHGFNVSYVTPGMLERI